MTEIEAKEYLLNRYLVVGSPLNPPKEECEKHNKVIDMAIEALEKQIPIAPSKANDEALKLDGIFDWCCGKCGTHHRNDFLLKYCSECGQALKWE